MLYTDESEEKEDDDSKNRRKEGIDKCRRSCLEGRKVPRGVRDKQHGLKQQCLL